MIQSWHPCEIQSHSRIHSKAMKHNILLVPQRSDYLLEIYVLQIVQCSLEALSLWLGQQVPKYADISKDGQLQKIELITL